MNEWTDVIKQTGQTADEVQEGIEKANNKNVKHELPSLGKKNKFKNKFNFVIKWTMNFKNHEAEVNYFTIMEVKHFNMWIFIAVLKTRSGIMLSSRNFYLNLYLIFATEQ